MDKEQIMKQMENMPEYNITSQVYLDDFGMEWYAQIDEQAITDITKMSFCSFFYLDRKELMAGLAQHSVGWFPTLIVPYSLLDDDKKRLVIELMDTRKRTVFQALACVRAYKF